MIRNIIFDWSGTLVDDLPAVLKATNYVLEQSGVEAMSRDKFRQEFCLPFKHFYDRFVPHVPLAQLETVFHGHFKEIQHDVEPLPHAREFLEFCRASKIRTYILSTVCNPSFETHCHSASKTHMNALMAMLLRMRSNRVEMHKDHQCATPRYASMTF